MIHTASLVHDDVVDEASTEEELMQFIVDLIPE